MLKDQVKVIDLILCFLLSLIVAIVSLFAWFSLDIIHQRTLNHTNSNYCHYKHIDKIPSTEK